MSYTSSVQIIYIYRFVGQIKTLQNMFLFLKWIDKVFFIPIFVDNSQASFAFPNNE